MSDAHICGRCGLVIAADAWMSSHFKERFHFGMEACLEALRTDRDAWRAKSEAAQQALSEYRATEHARFCEWRGITGSVCGVCYGTGQRTYPSTTTWRGGAGGMTLTGGVCDRCWGSGDADKPGANLRTLAAASTPTEGEDDGK